MRGVLERELDLAGPAALARLNDRFAAAGSDWTYYPPDPLARRLHHVLADSILDAGSRVTGLHHLDAVRGSPVVLCANHLSYSDANLFEILLHRAGAAADADRLTVVA